MSNHCVWHVCGTCRGTRGTRATPQRTCSDRLKRLQSRLLGCLQVANPSVIDAAGTSHFIGTDDDCDRCMSSESGPLARMRRPQTETRPAATQAGIAGAGGPVWGLRAATAARRRLTANQLLSRLTHESADSWGLTSHDAAGG